MKHFNKTSTGLISVILVGFLMAAFNDSPDNFNIMKASGEQQVIKEHVFYVSPTGNDNWSGKLEEPNRDKDDGPFATISHARDVIRNLQREEGGLKTPVKVYMKDGTYHLSETLVFKPEDSGSKGSRITYMSAPGERATISGGKMLNGFEEESDGLWKTVIPEVKNGSMEIRQLFRGDERLTRARIPEEEWFILEPASEDIEGDLSEQHKFHVKEGKVESYENLDQAELVVYNRWNNSRLFIESIDEEKQIVRFKGEIFRGPKEGKRFFIENIYEGLTQPDTWFLNMKTGELYLKTDENPNDGNIVAPAIEKLVEFRGDPSSNSYVSHIALKDLDFRYATFPVPDEGIRARQAASYLTGAIYAESAKHITIEGCDIQAVGQYGIDFNERCHHNRLVHNRLKNTGAGGIRIGTTERRLTDDLVAYHNVISDNFISDGGETAFGCIGIFAANCRHTTISHNEVTRMKYTGISIGWNWGWVPNYCRDNIIEKNYIHHVGMGMLSDMGGIYTLGVSPGTYIRGNVIHDVWPYHDSGRGIYLDQGSTGYIVEKNVVYKMLSSGLRLQRGTSGNIVQNNIFAFSREWMLGYDTDRFNVFQKNIVYWKEGTLFKRNRIYNYNTVISHNIYWNPENPNPEFAGLTFEEWKTKRRPKDFFVSFPTMDNNSYYADPMFKDPENGDFTLDPNSPAFQVGFEPIDVSDVGPREYQEH